MKHRIVLFLARTLGAAWLRFTAATVRTRVHGKESVDRLRGESGGVIYAVWHSRFWLPAALFGHEGSALLVSRSRDGDLIAAVAERLGYKTVRGSSSRGGSEALEGLQAALGAGRNAALTPDGPRGPRETAKPGAVRLSLNSGRPIVPVGAAAHPAKHFNSWDRFQMPHLFSRGCIVFGDAYWPDPELSLERQVEELGEKLCACQARAEREVGA